MPRVWNQFRSIQVDDKNLSQFDVDISVSKPKDDPLEYDLKVWNLTEQTWERFDKDSVVQIALGWESGERNPVIIGNVTDMNREPDRGDWMYQMTGIDISEDAIKLEPARNWRRRWRNEEPQDIVRSICNQLGLAVTVDEVGESISGVYSITGAKNVSGWFDDLLQHAADLSGVEWEWFSERGRVFFQQRSSTSGEAPRLSFDGILLNISWKEDENSDTETLEFEAMLDPRFRKGAAVAVDTERFSGVYKVKTYEFQSSDETGDHLVRGDLEKADGIQRRETVEEEIERVQNQMEGVF